MTSQLDDVNELIRMKKGDLYRLEHIKTTLENRKILYISDRKYLEGLTKTYLNSSIPRENLSKLNKNDYSEYQKRTDIRKTIPQTMGEPQKTQERITDINVEPQKTDDTFCTNCGNPISSENFCPTCETSTKNNSMKSNQNDPPPNNTPSKTKSRWSKIKKTLSVIGSVLFFLYMLKFVLFFIFKW